MAIVSRRIEGSFDRALFDFVAASEGFVPRVYSDPRGLPTLGLGFTMLDSTPGWPPRDSLDRDLAGIGIRLTPQDRIRLTAVGEALSCHDVAAARRLVSPWIPGEDPQARNGFSFLIDRAQAQALFELARPDVEAVLQRKLGRELLATLAGSRELVALFSLAYCNPALIGPKLCSALQRGARGEAWFEIRFGSNRQRHHRVQARRDQEAAMFGLTNEATPSAAERDALLELLSDRQPHIKRYLEELGLPRAEVKRTVAILWNGAGLPTPPCALPGPGEAPAAAGRVRPAAAQPELHGPQPSIIGPFLLDC
ncbi:hypothetical protein [Pelagibius sp. 7325]|uniref:hypothetical protein n=1 Tax=Pelagibius sp. 7325 TaxID=3131994 RepID=UPI0030EDF21D